MAYAGSRDGQAEAILLTDMGGERGWANARRVGVALQALGVSVERIVDGPLGEHGGLVIDDDGLDAGLLEDKLRGLKGDPVLGDAVAGVAVAPLPAERRAKLKTVPLSQPAIALFGSAGAPYHHLDIFATSGFDVMPVGSEAIRSSGLAGFDVFVMPGGGWEFMEGQLGRLGTAGAEQISDFVKRGGGYLSSCAGTHCVLHLPDDAAADWHPAYMSMPKLSAESWLKGDRSTHHVKSPGIGVIRTQIHDPAHPICAGLPPQLDCVYYNGPILVERAGGQGGTFASLLDCAGPDATRFTPGEALFAGTDVTPNDTAMAEAGRMGYSAGGIEKVGKGWVVGFGLHPEFGCEPSMLEWGRSARLLTNAAEWTASGKGVGANDGRATKPAAWPAGGSGDDAPDTLLPAAERVLEEIVARLDDLTDVDEAELQSWLDPASARSAFGQSPAALWAFTLQDGAGLARTMIERLRVWSETFRRLGAAAHASEPGHKNDLDALRRQALWLVAAEAVDREPQDLGYKGLLALLQDVKRLLETLTAIEAEGRSPYKAVAMSYLSASGRLSAASLVLSASQAMLVRGLLTAALR